MTKYLLLAVLTMATLAQAALGPTSPPPGLAGPKGARMWTVITTRANKAAEVAHAFNPKSSKACLESIFLRVFGRIEAVASGDDGLPVTVHPDKKDAFRKALDDNRDQNCTGGDGGATVQAMADFSLANEEWDLASDFRGPSESRASIPALSGERAEALRYLYTRAAPSMRPSSPSVLELLKLGILVPAPAAAGAAAPAGVGLPIINPELFMPRREPKPGEVY
ncbi:MAG TPA: hypothetical protein VEZ71_19360 [Archangium sp.]|nr:hypothetical protein [Archangium sp.]